MSAVLAFQAPPGKVVARGHGHYWSVIVALDAFDAPWSIADIRARSNVADRSSIRDYVKRLCAGGFAEPVPGEQPCYRLLRRQLATPRLLRDGTVAVQGRGQQQMWNTLRGPLCRAGFDFKELAVFASTEAVKVKATSAQSYVKHLVQGGYLAILVKGRPGRPARYSLKPGMNTGPRPPLVLRSQIVFDQNRMEAVGTVEAVEVAL